MIPFERQQMILHELESRDVVSYVELASILQVSYMTIRRDIQKLEQDGLVTSVSGGVRKANKISYEPSHADKELMAKEEKKLIGKVASNFIPVGKCIYLDAGTTSLSLCQFLNDRDDLTIVTNDFEVALYLMKNCASSIIHTGGEVRAKNRSSVGFLAASTIKSLNFDISFISASSWDLNGMTTPDKDKVIVKKTVIEQSQKKILISDSSKYKHIATYKVCALEDFDTIITDSKLDIKDRIAIENRGIELIIA